VTIRTFKTRLPFTVAERGIADPSRSAFVNETSLERDDPLARDGDHGGSTIVTSKLTRGIDRRQHQPGGFHASSQGELCWDR